MSWRRRWRDDAVSAYFTIGLCVLLGAPAGLLWSALAPHAAVVIDANGANFANAITEDFIAADVWFAGVSIVAGLLTGVLAWWLARGAGPFAGVALAVGGLLGALVAAGVGKLPGRDALQAAASAQRFGHYTANVALQSRAVGVVLWPAAALAVFLLLVLTRPDELD